MITLTDISAIVAYTTKTYYQNCQKHLDKPYQFVHTNLVGSINLISFLNEKYFFTFINDTTRMTKIYTGMKKCDWLKYLKIYYSLCRTRYKNKHLNGKLRSDYKLEL